MGHVTPCQSDENSDGFHSPTPNKRVFDGASSLVAKSLPSASGPSRRQPKLTTDRWVAFGLLLLPMVRSSRMQQVHSQHIGDWTVSLLRLATFHTQRQRFIPGAADGELLSFPLNALLCQRGADVVLVDAGEGDGTIADIPASHTDAIALNDALVAAGCDVEDVRVLVLTHLDRDHINGIVTGSRTDPTVVCPNACVLLPDGALEYARSTRLRPAEVDAGLVLAALNSASIEIREIGDGGEVVTGMRLLFAPGHREVHAAVEILHASQRFLYLADLLHVPEETEHPEWEHSTDADPVQAVETRRRMLDSINPCDLIAFSHLDGFGRIQRARGRRVWTPIT